MKIAFYTSTGYSSNSIDFYLSNLKDQCDLFFNYYGDDNQYYNNIKQYAVSSTHLKTTKFPALKNLFLNSDIKTYDYILVFDDDMIMEYGDILSIPYIMQQYSIDIASSCHSNFGRFSHHIMLNHTGNHLFRYTNFIEMNFPIFNNYALNKYMINYDGILCGWGNDWWYLNVLDCNNKKNCAIIDSVCIKNPHHEEKQFMTIDKFMDRESRHDQWKLTRHKFDLHQWNMKNIEFIYE